VRSDLESIALQPTADLPSESHTASNLASQAVGIWPASAPVANQACIRGKLHYLYSSLREHIFNLLVSYTHHGGAWFPQAWILDNAVGSAQVLPICALEQPHSTLGEQKAELSYFLVSWLCDSLADRFSVSFDRGELDDAMYVTF
jgi:hypothetical protein